MSIEHSKTEMQRLKKLKRQNRISKNYRTITKNVTYLMGTPGEERKAQ